MSKSRRALIRPCINLARGGLSPAMAVNFMAYERDTREALLPRLDERLCEIPFLERERPRNGSVAAFRDAGGPGLLVPREHGGRGATPLQAVRVQRAIATRSPSLAVAT